jgi:magnesium chelatase subunit D
VRAKRSLAGLPGGGGTPLAAGIVGACELARGIERSGETAVVVLLTDGRANVALDGAPGRERAHQDALGAARRLRETGVAAVLLDIGAAPQAQARDIAAALGARYIALPHAQAGAMARAVAGKTSG